MDVLIIGTANAKTPFPNELVYKLRNPLRVNGTVKLISGWLYYNWKNVTSGRKNTQFIVYDKKNDIKYFVTLPDGSYNVSDINGALKHILKTEHGLDVPYDIFTANPVCNRISIYLTSDLEIELYPGVAYMFGAVDNSMDYDTFLNNAGSTLTSFTNVDKVFDYIPKIEPVNRVLIHCSIVDNPCRFDNTLLFSFTPKTVYGSIISIEPYNNIDLRTKNTEIHEIKLWLTNQKGEPLGIEDEMEFIIAITSDPNN